MAGNEGFVFQNEWVFRLAKHDIAKSNPQLYLVNEFAKKYGKHPNLLVDAMIDYNNGLYERSKEFGPGFKEFMKEVKSA